MKFLQVLMVAALTAITQADKVEQSTSVEIHLSGLTVL